MLDRLESLTRVPLRIAATNLHRLLKTFWFFRRPRTLGAHAVALTPDEKIVLVKLRYALGWRLPGGGRKGEEDPREAVLRELEEEIGLTSHGEVQFACELMERPDVKRDTASLLIVRDVEYKPRWSLEVEAVTEARLGALPANMSPRALKWIERVRPML